MDQLRDRSDNAPTKPRRLPFGRSPFDDLDRPALWDACVRFYSAVDAALELMRSKAGLMQQSARGCRALIEAELALRSARGSHKAAEVHEQFFMYAGQLVFGEAEVDGRTIRWLCCDACGRHARETLVTKLNGTCLRMTGSGRCSGRFRELVQGDLLLSGEAAGTGWIAGCTGGDDAGVMGPRAPRALEYGATPFDRLDRPALLFQCLRLSSAALQARTQLQKHRLEFRSQHALDRVLRRLQLALQTVDGVVYAGGARNSFLCQAEPLLFGEVALPGRTGRLKCDTCGASLSAAAGEPDAVCGEVSGTSCAGRLRPYTWADFAVSGGPAQAIYGQAFHGADADADADVAVLLPDVSRGRASGGLAARVPETTRADYADAAHPSAGVGEAWPPDGAAASDDYATGLRAPSDPDYVNFGLAPWWTGRIGAAGTTKARQGRTPLDKLTRSALLYQCILLYSVVDAAYERLASDMYLVRQSDAVMETFVRAQLSLASALGPYSRAEVNEKFFTCAEQLLFADVAELCGNRWTVCGQCRRMARESAVAPGGPCAGCPPAWQDRGVSRCSGTMRLLEWSDLYCPGGPVDQIQYGSNKVWSEDDIFGMLRRRLLPGQTPFDLLPRPALLFQSIRLFSTVKALRKLFRGELRPVLATSGWSTLAAKARAADRSARGPCFHFTLFREADCLLFDDAVRPIGKQFLVCTRCKRRIKDPVSCRPGDSVYFGKACTVAGCGGTYRSIAWSDEFAQYGIAHVVYQAVPRSAPPVGSGAVKERHLSASACTAPAVAPVTGRDIPCIPEEATAAATSVRHGVGQAEPPVESPCAPATTTCAVSPNRAVQPSASAREDERIPPRVVARVRAIAREGGLDLLAWSQELDSEALARARRKARRIARKAGLDLHGWAAELAADADPADPPGGNG